MPRITPYQKWLELQNYVQEFRQKKIRVIEVQTEDELGTGTPGVELYPQEKGGVRVELVKIGYRNRRTITGELKALHFGIKRRYTLSFLYCTQEEKDRIDTQIFRQDYPLHLTFFDDEQALNKVRVKMVNNLSWDARPSTSKYDGGVTRVFGDKTFDGQVLYLGVSVVLEEI